MIFSFLGPPAMVGTSQFRIFLRQPEPFGLPSQDRAFVSAARVDTEVEEYSPSGNPGLEQKIDAEETQLPTLMITGRLFNMTKKNRRFQKFGIQANVQFEAKGPSAYARYWIEKPNFISSNHVSPAASGIYKGFKRRLSNRKKRLGWCWYLSRPRGFVLVSSVEEEIGDLEIPKPKEFNRVWLTYASDEDERFYGFGEQFSHMNFKGKRVPIFVQEQGIGRGDQPITLAANLVSYRAGGDSSTTYAPSPFYMTSKMRSVYLEGYEYTIFDLTRLDRVQIQVKILFQLITDTQNYGPQINRELVEEWKSNNLDNVKKDQEEGLVFFMRAGFRDSPKWGMLFWEGDQMVSWQTNDGIKSSVVGLLSSGISGYAFNHSDIGGYCTVNLPIVKYRRSQELLLRWMELNSFTTVFRTHEGNKPSCNSQFYSNQQTLSHFARSAKVYTAWKFYRTQLVKEAAQKGLPVCRHLFLHYPNDERVHHLSYQQFLVGSEFLVVPVLDKGKKKVKAYFPLGESSSWQHIWTGKYFPNKEVKHG
ncbi:Glycosyl hydrolase, all-beta [Sesbania bispinosa]|nr:Glycosyl hydrolase, all-beta [Sesbania bispinosa]